MFFISLSAFFFSSYARKLKLMYTLLMQRAFGVSFSLQIAEKENVKQKKWRIHTIYILSLTLLHGRSYVVGGVHCMFSSKLGLSPKCNRSCINADSHRKPSVDEELQKYLFGTGIWYCIGTAFPLSLHLWCFTRKELPSVLLSVVSVRLIQMYSISKMECAIVSFSVSLGADLSRSLITKMVNS